MYSLLRKIFSVTFLVLLLFSFSINDVKSSHIAGGYIQYECTGNPNEYIITMVLYRDCTGINAPGSPSINYSNTCGHNNGSLNLNLISDEEISQLCDDDISNSTCNGGSLPGYEEYIYQATITLPECDSWTLEYGLCCRNPVNNVQGATGCDFYTQTNMYSGTDNCNTSPTTTAQPLPFVCVNQEVNYNLGAYEPDGNDVEYSLVTSQCSNGNPVNYNGGYSAEEPIPGMTINPNTGNVNFTPTELGNFIVVIQMTEYDENGNIVSVTNYDYQIEVINCTNTPPDVDIIEPDPNDPNAPPESGIQNVVGAGLQTGPHEITFCADNATCFDVVFVDPDEDDILTVTSNLQNIIPEADFTTNGTNPVTVTICWTPPIENTSYNVNFLVEDDACPITGQSNYSISLIVLPYITVDLGGDQFIGCQETTSLTADVQGGNGNYTFEWSTGETTQTITDLGPGTYWVEVHDDSETECFAYQEVEIASHPDPTADFSYTEVCETNPTSFQDESTESSLAIVSWEWDMNGDGQIDETGQTPNYTFPDPGTYDVTLFIVDGNDCSSSVTLPVVVHPKPNTDFNFTPVCLGEEMNFTDASTIVTGDITQWNWDFDDANTSTDQNPNHQYANSGIYNVTLTTTSGFGCTDEITQEVEVYSLPVVDFEPVDVCFDTPTEFFDLTQDDYGIDQWDWDFGDGSPINNEQSPIHNYNQDNQYDATLTVTSVVGCEGSVTNEVNVFPLPVADFTYDVVCATTVTPFTNESTVNAPSTIEAYYWDINNNGIVNYFNENPNHTFNAGGDYDVSLVVETEFGCTDTLVSIVTVDPLPEPDFSATTVCLGDETNFTDESTVVSGAVTGWSWDFGDGSPISNEQHPGHTYDDDGNYNVTLEATTDNGCVYEITQEITVLHLPTADFTTNNQCFYDNFVFIDQSTNDVVGWEWDFGDNNSSNSPSPFHEYASAGDYTVELIVTTADGCQDTAEMDVTAYPKPVAEFTSTEACFGYENEFNSNSNVAPPSEIVEYLWSFDDGNTSNDENPIHLYGGEGVYDVTLVVTTDHGCMDTTTVPTPVYPLPQVDFTPTDVCLLVMTDFTDLTTISNAYTTNSLISWQWDFGDGSAINNQQNPSHEYDEHGAYDAQLIVTSNHGCVDSITKVVTVHPLPEVSFVSNDTVGCHPVAPQFVSTSSIATGTITQYIWDYGDDIRDTIPDPTSWHVYENEYHEQDMVQFFDVTLIAISDMGCIDSITKVDHIQVYPIPDADFVFAPNVQSTYNPEFSFTNTTIGGNTYQWDFGGLGNSEQEHTSFMFPHQEGGEYPIELIATNVYGCKDTVIKTVIVEEELIVYVPNAFTPDGDGINELFGPVIQGYDLRDYSFHIYNRWGELIFESYHPEVMWDGRHRGQMAKQGVYVWKLVVKRDGTSDKKEFMGHVTLLK